MTLTCPHLRDLAEHQLLCLIIYHKTHQMSIIHTFEFRYFFTTVAKLVNKYQQNAIKTNCLVFITFFIAISIIL